MKDLKHAENLSLDAPRAAVMVWNRELISFRTTVRTRTPKDRVAAAKERFAKIPNFELFGTFSLEDLNYDGVNAVFFSIDGYPLFTLFESDIDPTSSNTLQEEAQAVLERLQELQAAAKEQKSPELLISGIIFALASTLIMVVFMTILRRTNRFLRGKILKRTAKVTWMKWKGFDVRQYTMAALKHATNWVFILLQLTLLYFWLGLILSRFPFTRPLAKIIGNHFSAALLSLVESILSSIPNLLIVALIFYVSRGLARIANGLSDTLEQTEDDDEESWLSRDTAKATRKILVVLIWVAGVMVAYPYIPGSGSEAFKGIGVLLGLMISLGSSGMVNQVMSGFVTLYSGGVRSGEYIVAGNIEGVVTDVRLLSTRIRTPKNEFITVPNAVLISQHSTNLSRHKGEEPTQVATAVTIGYDTPWRQVDALLLKAVAKTKGIRRDPAPKVLKTDLSDWYIRYELRFVPGRIEKKNQVLSDLHVNILDVFNEFGVQIMSPHFIDQPEEDLVVDKENWSPPPAEQA